MPLGYSAREQGSAEDIARALAEIAGDIQALAKVPGGSPHPELEAVARDVKAAARLVNAGAQAKKLPAGKIAEIGALFEAAGRTLREQNSGKRGRS